MEYSGSTGLPTFLLEKGEVRVNDIHHHLFGLVFFQLRLVERFRVSPNNYMSHSSVAPYRQPLPVGFRVKGELKRE
jgi:hypothetical protein